MRPPIRAIEIFVRVVESGSFVAAARSLLIDPAAVSRAIKALEENLGTLLFTRSTRVLKLTTEGARFYRDGSQMLRRFEETIRRFQDDKALHGQLKVGLAPGLTRRMLLRAIPSFHHLYPEVRLVLLSISETAEIGNEGIDVLIRPLSLRQRGATHKQPQGLVVRKLVQSPLVACASPEYLKRVGIPRTPADLAQHDCIAMLTLERDVHEEWQFARFGTRQKVKIAPKLIAHGDALREAGLVGCGIIRLLACSVEDEIRSGTLLRILPDWDCVGGSSIGAIYRKARPTSSRVNALVQHLAQAFQHYSKGALSRNQAPSSKLWTPYT